jgi:putative glycerol-1-phosphate prenyltransferase
MNVTELHKMKDAGQKGLVVLIDPDKCGDGYLDELLTIAAVNKPTFFFVGGSLMTTQRLNETVQFLKNNTDVPVILFPGSGNQIDENADAILLLSLVSGRNPELLIGEHVKAAPALKASGLGIWSTGYILVDGGAPTTASYISGSQPVPRNKPEITAVTAMAAEMIGMQCIYLDAGSGAQNEVSPKMINSVSKSVDLPIIVGGGMKTRDQLEAAWNAGATLVVVGNAIEKEPALLESLSESGSQL